MKRIVETVVGLALIATALYLLLAGREHSDWLLLALVGVGGHFVSKSLMGTVVKRASAFLPWKRGEP